MSVSRVIRLFAALLVLGVFAAACGQKEGVHVGFAGGQVGANGQPVTLNSEGVPVDASGVPIDTDGDGTADTVTGAAGSGAGGTTAGTTGGTTTSGGTTAGGTTGGTTSGGNDGSSGSDPQTASNNGGGDSQQGGDPQQPQQPQGKGDSTGITATTIKIGVHAPLTGAAPIPQRSFFAGKDQYWDAVGKIYGRDIEVVFRDDKYNPSSASQVCQELILKEKVFMLAGSGGTDQIAECARIAAAYGVPYLSAGVTRVRLDQLSNYYAQSKSYSDQMPLLFQWIKKFEPPANKRVGIIASNTANFDDAVAAFEAEAKKVGYTPYVYRPSKAPSDGELAGVAQKMVTDQVKVGTPVMQPTAWIKMAKNAQLRDVQWAGIGVTMGLNSVANVVCPDAAGAMFFSPFPGFNMATEMDPRAKVAEDDIQWAQWGSNKGLHEIFKRMDGNLTREAFNKAMLGPIDTGIFPPTSHTASDHFRVDSVHVLHMDCSKRQFVSSPSDLFRKSF